ncbi:UNVERIFIED_ORG: hypothetical protein J3D58_001594 [Paenarthrobacter nicotinovorans]
MSGGNEVEDFFEQELASARKVLTPDLYHYTSSEAAILGILANRTIRMSPFQGTNDLWESRPLWPSLEGELSQGESSGHELHAIWEDVDRYIRGYSKVACFTQDWEVPDLVMRPDAFRGWAHLSLWAHYGAGHTGVCLRFDRDRLAAAFDAARGDATHQFHGPVLYRRAEAGAGAHAISLEQAEEFGIDAVALRYAYVHREGVFFHKHADWASESEFRLVRTDLSTEPHYFDITNALTGVVLGDAFPPDRIPALRNMLAGFEHVDVYQARFHNRVFELFPMEVPAKDQVALWPAPVTCSAILPRRSGDLAQRLRTLEEVERSAEIAREEAMKVAAPILEIWRQSWAGRPELFENWPSVVVNAYPDATAIPHASRRKRPGIPGNAVAYEAGLMIVAENQPQYTFTLVLAIAVQIMSNGGGKFHACITTEERGNGSPVQHELYRDLRHANADELMAVARQVWAGLTDALPNARMRFDELRAE